MSRRGEGRVIWAGGPALFSARCNFGRADTVSVLVTELPQTVPSEPRVSSRTIVESDRRAVARTLEGDTAAFSEIVTRYEDIVHRVAARVVGLDEADDVAQETFLRAFNRLKQYRGDSPFRSWLLQIAFNTAVDAANRRRPEVPGDLPEQHDLSQREPAMRLEETERRERLETKLALLRPEHRAVLVLRDLEGLPYEEISNATETPLGSVKGRIHRARGELIELMRRNTYDWELPE